MELKIVSDKDNLLLKRREVQVELAHTGKATPQRKEIMAGLAKSLKTKEDMIIIDKIFTRKGLAASDAHILVYSSEKDIPPAKKEKQKGRMERKAKGEAKAEQEPGPKPEKPKAEKPLKGKQP